MNKYKPSGWRNESYRHYLAAKGITTKKYYSKRQYMADQMMPLDTLQVPKGIGKGNVADGTHPKIQRLRAAGWTDADLLSNYESLVNEVDPKTGESLLDAADVRYIMSKESKKQKFSERYPAPSASGLSGPPEPLSFGTRLPQVQFEDKLTEIPGANFGPSIDVPAELPQSSEAQQIVSDLEIKQLNDSQVPSEPLPLTEAKSRVATAPVGLPENLLI